jgi:superoxide dismutase, Cu-Zn family
MSIFIIAIAIVAVLAPAGALSGFTAELGGKKVKMVNGDRQEVGEVTVTETPSGVLIRLDLQRNPAKIAPGAHAVHIHEVGQCVPPFKSAGAHLNPMKKKHGFLDKQGTHVGDLPNLHVPQDGPLTVEMMIPHVSLSSGRTNLVDGDGFALVIHQGGDDYKTDPAGDSGDRIACAAIEGSAQSK